MLRVYLSSHQINILLASCVKIPTQKKKKTKPVFLKQIDFYLGLISGSMTNDKFFLWAICPNPKGPRDSDINIHISSVWLPAASILTTSLT